MNDNLDSAIRSGLTALGEAAGPPPVLDDLLAPVPRSPGQGTERSRLLLAAAAIVLVVAAGAVAIGLNGPSSSQTVTMNDRGAGIEAPSASQGEVDEALVAKLKERQAAAVENCGQDTGAVPPTTAVQKTDRILVGGGANCEYGQVDAQALDSGEADVRPLPVYPPDGGDEIIGYWASGVGWLTVEDVKDPGFDLAAHQRAGAEALGITSGSSQDPPG